MEKKKCILKKVLRYYRTLLQEHFRENSYIFPNFTIFRPLREYKKVKNFLSNLFSD